MSSFSIGCGPNYFVYIGLVTLGEICLGISKDLLNECNWKDCNVLALLIFRLILVIKLKKLFMCMNKMLVDF